MKLYLISIWSIIDSIYYVFTRLTHLDMMTDEKNNIFRVRLTRYKGNSVILSDGTKIQKNDLLVKIHLHNVRLIKEIEHINSEVRRGSFIYKWVERSLPDLITFIDTNDKKDEIKGIIGITTLNKGSRRLGFDSFCISNPIYKWFKSITFLPICILSSTTPLLTIRKRQPKYLFMSKKMLIKKYGSKYNFTNNYH